LKDDDAIRNKHIALLKLEGFEVVSAINGRLGLERARLTLPDVVISDVSMPEMDGLQMVEAIRADKALAATPVLLLTALDDRSQHAPRHGCGRRSITSRQAIQLLRAELLEALHGLIRKRARIEDSISSGRLAAR